MKTFAPLLKLTLIVMLAIGASARVSANPFACLRLLSPVYPYEDQKQAFLKSPASNQSRFLGEGASAAVFLIRDPSNRDSVLVKKVYHQDAHGSKRFEEDAATLDALRTVSGPRTFAVVQAKRQMAYQAEIEMTELFLVMSFVPGRTLHDLLLDPKVPEKVRTELIRTFESKLSATGHELAKQNLATSPTKQMPPELKYFADGSLDRASMLLVTLKGSHSLLIKSDNVIVDPADLNKMTIVDPY